MDRSRLLFLIAQHDHLLGRISRLVAADKRGEPQPDEAALRTDEVEGFDLALTDAIVEITGGKPLVRDWVPPNQFSKEGEERYEGRFARLRAYQEGLIRSKNYFTVFLAVVSPEVHMGDKITVGAAQVVMGSHANAGSIAIQGSVLQSNSEDARLNALADELSKLRKALRLESDPNILEHDITMGAVAEAEVAAKSGDLSAALGKLKSVGKWCLGVAEKIGVSIATDAIKQAAGIGK